MKEFAVVEETGTVRCFYVGRWNPKIEDYSKIPSERYSTSEEAERRAKELNEDSQKQTEFFNK